MCLHRPKEGLFQAQTSRYLSEFEEISRLGKGSYGNVFKVFSYFIFHTNNSSFKTVIIIGIHLIILQVLNKLDGQCYAVKKILIKQVSKEDCMKVNLQVFFILLIQKTIHDSLELILLFLCTLGS